jgi:hypothetical protein
MCRLWQIYRPQCARLPPTASLLAVQQVYRLYSKSTAVAVPIDLERGDEEANISAVTSPGPCNAFQRLYVLDKHSLHVGALPVVGG